MKNVTTAALFFLAAGIVTSVTILSAYQILFGIPFIYYTYLAIKNKEGKLPASAWWLLGFAVIAVISLLINFDLVPKPSKNFGRVKYFLFGICGVYVFRVWLKEASDKTKKMLLNVFFLSVVIAGIYSMWEVWGTGRIRAKGLTDTMRYGYGSGMFLLTLLSALLHREKIKDWFDARWGAVAFVVGFVGMYLTYTRGGLLGFLCGLPFVLYFYRPKLGVIFGGLALLGVAGLGGVYLFGSGNFNSRYLVNKNYKSDVIRRSQWKAAIIATQEKPLLGWGFSNFHTQLRRIKRHNYLDARKYDDAHAHNIFLEISSGTGLIGLFFFLGWLFSWAWECFKGGVLTRAMIIPFGVALMVSGQFEMILDANNASTIFFIYAMSVAAKERLAKIV